jgi:hypothetical protein
VLCVGFWPIHSPPQNPNPLGLVVKKAWASLCVMLMGSLTIWALFLFPQALGGDGGRGG